jgi:hypothetical protein
MLAISMSFDDRRAEELSMFNEYVVRALVDDHVKRLQREAVAERLARVAVRAMSEARPQRTAVGRVLRSLDPARARHAVSLPSGRPQPCGC